MEQAVRAQVLPRVTLAVSAGALFDLDPRNNPFLTSLIVAFSLGRLSKGVAQNLAQLLLQVSSSGKTPGASTAPGSATLSEMAVPGTAGMGLLADLVGELLGGTSTCQQLGEELFEFFKIVQQAMLPLEEALKEGGPSGEESEDTVVEKSNHLLGWDASLLLAATFVAQLVDDPRANLPEVVALIVCSFLCIWLLLASISWVWRRVRWRQGSG
ncbi:unnamed protein product [Choristocarpus tenellus]